MMAESFMTILSQHMHKAPAPLSSHELARDIPASFEAVVFKCMAKRVEATGAPKIHQSLRAGRVIELATVTTAANTLAPRRSHELNFAIIQETVDDVVLVTDDEMRAAARWLWFEAGVAAELSGAASLAAILTGKIPLAGIRSACAVVCGAGTDGLGEG